MRRIFSTTVGALVLVMLLFFIWTSLPTAGATMLVRKVSGGAAPAFTPTDLGTDKLKGWWKPDTAVFTHESGANAASSDGDVIAYNGDQSGNGNHIIQATAADKPTLQNEAGDLINGHPVMRCDGTDGLHSSTVGSSLTGNFYAAAVFKTTDVSGDVILGWGDASQGESRGVSKRGTTGVGRYFGFNEDVESSINVSDGSPHIVEIWSDGTNVTVCVDGTTTTATPALNAYTGTDLGVGHHTNGGYDFEGDIAESLVGVNLTAANMTSVRGYLNDRFSVY